MRMMRTPAVTTSSTGMNVNRLKRFIKPCHQAMTIRGSCAEWHAWAGMKFPQSGQYILPGALNPMEMNIEKDEGVYVEPNVWMVHEIG